MEWRDSEICLATLPFLPDASTPSLKFIDPLIPTRITSKNESESSPISQKSHQSAANFTIGFVGLNLLPTTGLDLEEAGFSRQRRNTSRRFLDGERSWFETHWGHHRGRHFQSLSFFFLLLFCFGSKICNGAKQSSGIDNLRDVIGRLTRGIPWMAVIWI